MQSCVPVDIDRNLAKTCTNLFKLLVAHSETPLKPVRRIQLDWIRSFVAGQFSLATHF
jgi:hypothetical protein